MTLSLEQQIIELIDSFESFLKKSAVYNRDEIIDYENDDFEIIEVFDDLNESMLEVIKPVLPLIENFKMEISDIPEIARFDDFKLFGEFFERHKLAYPHIAKWSSTFVQYSTTYWDPLNWAIRDTYHQRNPDRILNRRVFELYFQGYVKISETTKYGWSGGYEIEILRILELLKDSKFATNVEMSAIETLEEEIRHAYDDTIPYDINWNFQGTTRHLEREVWTSIRSRLFSTLDESDLDFFEEQQDEPKSPQDQDNFEGLIMKWSSRPAYSLSDKLDSYWKIVEGDYLITIEQGEKKLEVIVPIVYQLVHRSLVGELLKQNIVEEALEFWKASLLRVGTRDEYTEIENLEQIATISVALASALNCGLEKISSEIDWLRTQEKEIPLIGRTEVDIRLYSQDYFNKNSL